MDAQPLRQRDPGARAGAVRHCLGQRAGFLAAFEHVTGIGQLGQHHQPRALGGGLFDQRPGARHVGGDLAHRGAICTQAIRKSAAGGCCGKTLACHLLHFWNRTRRTIRRRKQKPPTTRCVHIGGFHSQKVNSGGNHCRGYRHCRARAAVEADLGSHDRKAGGGAAIRDFPDKSSRNDTTTGSAGVTIALRKIPRTAPCPRAAPGRSRTQGLMRDGFRCPSAPGATIDDA